MQGQLCITVSGSDPVQVEFVKGQIEYVSATGTSALLSSFYPSNGDSIVTGSGGFAKLALANGSHYNLQPQSTLLLITSSACKRYQAINDLTFAPPFQSAAVRG